VKDWVVEKVARLLFDQLGRKMGGVGRCDVVGWGGMMLGSGRASKRWDWGRVCTDVGWDRAVS